MLEYENYKKNKLIEENINKLGERMYKPEIKKLELVENNAIACPPVPLLFKTIDVSQIPLPLI
mgnify:CR=1 FL=1